MRSILHIMVFIFLSSKFFGQDCYVMNRELLQNNYSNVWLNMTYQGTIGENNQRIEIRFVSVSKLNDTTYYVIGKSKVNSNICDFSGKLWIHSSKEIDDTNSECFGPDYATGFLSGKYEINENETQSHVGQFYGDFITVYDKTSTGFIVNRGSYGQEGISEFTGVWKDYKKDMPKYCSWGIQIPPTKRNDLFKHYDNEFYTFNSLYIDKGWRTYVLANLHSFVVVPKDFNAKNPDFLTFDKLQIEKSRKKENEKWWE